MRRPGSSYYQAEILTDLGELAALYVSVEDLAADRVRARLATVLRWPFLVQTVATWWSASSITTNKHPGN